VGIQLGKTKVFLRHKAFEALEHIRSAEQTKAATKLNSIFRRYLARLAYLPYRDAFRMELLARRRMFEDGEFKETKEPDIEESGTMFIVSEYGKVHGGFPFHRGDFTLCGGASLVDKWMESKIRDAIHNPVPRHEWGKQAPTGKDFKWVLSEGIWVKKYDTDYDANGSSVRKKRSKGRKKKAQDIC
jgi:hypothetical protein